MQTQVIIDFIFDADCPNVSKSRENLIEVITRVGIAVELREWDRAAADTPVALRSFGSPTILVDGYDLLGITTEAAASCCRLYSTTAGASAGVPTVSLIEAAMRATGQPRS